MDTFELKIVTPSGLLLDVNCMQVNLPATEGKMGVLAGHMNLVSMLEPGLVEIFTDTSSIPQIKFIVADGFAEINGKQCILLVEEGVELNSVNVEEFKKKLEQYRQELNQATLMVKRNILTNQIKFLESALKVYERHN